MYDKERQMVKIFASTTASLIIISRNQDGNPQNQSVKATVKRAIKISVARAYLTWANQEPEHHHGDRMVTHGATSRWHSRYSKAQIFLLWR